MRLSDITQCCALLRPLALITVCLLILLYWMVLDGIDTMLDGIINDLMCLKAKPRCNILCKLCSNFPPFTSNLRYILNDVTSIPIPLRQTILPGYSPTSRHINSSSAYLFLNSEN